MKYLHTPFKSYLDFLLGSPLMFIVAVHKCFTNINALIFVPFNWACVNSVLLIRSYEMGIEVKNILACISRWRVIFSVHTGLSLTLLSAGAVQALAFHQHDSCALLYTWQCPHCQPHWNTVWQRWGGTAAFQGQGHSRFNWVLSCLELALSGHDFCHESVSDTIQR